MTLTLIITNLPRPPPRPILIHPRLILKNNQPPPNIIIPPLQPRPPSLSKARQPAAHDKAQQDANRHADEEPAQDLVPARAVLGDLHEAASVVCGAGGCRRGCCAAACDAGDDVGGSGRRSWDGTWTRRRVLGEVGVGLDAQAW
ncbi:hypothetical protein CCMA1212_001441 [Trichoderma ghanense]|uniref:Uncharacterized protein n=1 Tax=Trichoderma ghanense TaxID=65468 RepID=A0ABY2HCF5_9HYPO